MLYLKLERLKPIVAESIKPFFEELINKGHGNIHSILIRGSALTEDFDEKISDINSVVILKEMDLKFLEVIAPLGNKYRKKKVAAPLIMTPEYILKSLDVFPVEFMDIKLNHETVYGEDIFKDIEIKKEDLRHQCERELKVKLIGLRQGYISSLGNRKILTDGFIRSISGYMPLFRGIIYLLGKTPPIKQHEVITTLSEVTGINTDVFDKVLKEKKQKRKLSIDELNTIFEDYYNTIEKIGKIVDEFTEV